MAFLGFIFVCIFLIDLILDIICLQKALIRLDKCGGILSRPQLEHMFCDIQGKWSRAKLVARLFRLNIQLIREWTHSRPVIGMEREDQLLTSLDTKDLPLAH